MIKNYFRVALRNLWRNKIFSGINIAGLSVGLACCMLILLYLKDEVSFDRFHKNQAQIYRIISQISSPDGKVNKNGITGMMPGPEFKASIPEIESFVRLQGNGYTIKHNSEIYDQPVLVVDDNFFSVFSFPLVEGSAANAFSDMHNVVLTEATAKKYFGNKKAVGQVLNLKNGDKFEPFVVSAVAKNIPQNSSIQFEMLVPMKFVQSQNNDTEWINFFLNTFVVLKPGTDWQKVAAKFDKVFEVKAADQIKQAAEKYNFKEKISFGLQPLLDIHLSTEYTAQNGLDKASNPVYSYILSGIAIFILLIACINFINLTVSRSLKRAKEIGIRKVVGGQRKQLVMQFLGESMILSLISFVLALVLVFLILPVFNSLANKSLAFSYLADAPLIIGYIALFLITGLLAGFYPAMVLSGFNPVQTLYGRQRFTGKNYLSKGMVVFQFSLACLLIIATIVIYSQFNYLMKFDLGYNVKNVGRVNVGNIDKEKLALFGNELMKNPAIEKVTANQGGRWGTIAQVNNGTDISFDFKIIDHNYFPLFEIPIVQGRNFSPDLASDTAEGAIVNQSFVEKAGWKNPIGEKVDFFYNKKKYTVIGVIRDYHYQSLAEKIQPQLFITNPAYKYGDVFIKFKPASIASVQPYIAATFKNFFPVQPYQFNSKELDTASQYESELKWKQMITFSAILTIFISCIGLFGLATFAAEKRTKEIGIRKVLGASIPVIVRTLSTDFLKLVLLSTLIASPVAWWVMNKWLDNYPYRIQITWWVFGLTILLATGIALLTISYQAIRAAMANPVNSLKTE
ncbi:ABC transporter permease [Flavihumibacter profundi]|uniref:ABC transporter permease n=1 Tax=Flavihumibacter profundi TaxID=2716883 RepID=UPI001CC7D185|nr:ABC transporter permease [Flavihumibacter profundi]MBZ5855824.1 ABC transporter permease [Flavihumibacter profundi]